MSRIFLSHSSTNNAEAVALRDWLASNGWKDEIFLDLDPQRGIAAGGRWERALHEAANRCEAILFLVSKAWLASVWCRRELNLAHSLNKRLFGVLIEDLPIGDLPEDLAGTWQIVRLAAGRDHVMLRAVLPITHEEPHVHFSAEGLQRLKHGLEEAGLDAKYFAWPPQNAPDRPPYCGLRPLEAEDAGIFFGRGGPIVEALDRLRGLRATTPPRLLVILGASGAGKSSFLRAGLFPRLKRDDRNFLPLPVIRPERAAINGEAGLIAALEDTFAAAKIPIPRADLRVVVQTGAVKLKPLLQTLADKVTPKALDADTKPRPPTLILSIDQAEELFLAEAQQEAQPFLALLRDLLNEDAPAVIAVFTIRSDNYERLQLAPELEGVRQDMLSLSPMPRGSYAEVIKGPARRLEGTERALDIEDALVDALLDDIESGGAKDALPLLAFTLERLYGEYHAGGTLKQSHYDALGRVKGSIEAAVERALKAADADPAIPRDRVARLALLRRGLIPWLAGIDPDTGAPRRRVARLSEVPAEARPLIGHLVEQRLLATDIAKETGEQTIEPVHEALLRQWGLLNGWLAEDAGHLGVLEGIKRGSRDWAANRRDPGWLVHIGGRLRGAERLYERPDLSAYLEPTDRKYLAACRRAERAEKCRKRLLQVGVGVLAVAIVGLGGWFNRARLDDFVYFLTEVRSHVLGADAEQAKKPGDAFQECVRCPEMMVVPPGKFTMGSPATESGREEGESPEHQVSIAQPFAIARHETTFDEWAACVDHGGCRDVDDGGFGRGLRPVINVSWDDAERYVAWLARLTGRPYRLPSEAEWEYAARAKNPARFPFGDDEAALPQHAWFAANSDGKTHPVGEKKANAFSLFDMLGNVAEWCEDTAHQDYAGAPKDGSAWAAGDTTQRVLRGGAWYGQPGDLRSAGRARETPAERDNGIGFRVARTLRR